MCTNVRTARFQCFRLYGHINACRADPMFDDGHYYDSQTGLEWGIHPGDDDGVGLSVIAKDAKPLCKLYEELQEQERLNPPEPKTQRPGLIQRLKSTTRNNKVLFAERYRFDYMGNSNFEAGQCMARIREMADVVGIGRTIIGGFKVVFLYNPRNYNEQGAIETLKQIYDRRQPWWIEEDPYFNSENCSFVVKALRDRKAWNRAGDIALFRHVDAWFDIEHGLFWTVDNINPTDVRLNFELQVRRLDELRRFAPLHGMMIG